MKRYQDRRLRGFSKAVTVAYLVSAISFGASCFAFSIDRAIVKSDYEDGGMSHQMYKQKCNEISEREEKVFKTIFVCFGATFVIDVVTGVIERD